MYVQRMPAQRFMQEIQGIQNTQFSVPFADSDDRKEILLFFPAFKLPFSPNFRVIF